MKKNYSFRNACIFSAILCAISFYAFQNHITLLREADVEKAQIVGCENKRFSQSGSLRKNLTQYTPIAISEQENKAIGSVWFDKDICERVVNTQVDIFVHPIDSSKNRIASFTHFWLFPSLVGMLILLTFSASLAPQLVVFVFMFYFAFGAYQFLSEYQLLGIEGDGALITVGDVSELSLNQCVRERMDKKGLQARTDVKHLVCQDAGITALSSIADLVHLEELYLQGNRLTSLESLPRFMALKRLSVAMTPSLQSVEGIENAPNLIEFQANGSAIEDLGGLEKLTQLETVGLMRNHITDISVFSDLKQIKDVTLSSNKISDISSFSDKPLLFDFQIYGNKVTDISPLYHNQALKIVGIGENGGVPCDQIYRMRMSAPMAKVYGPKACD